MSKNNRNRNSENTVWVFKTGGNGNGGNQSGNKQVNQPKQNKGQNQPTQKQNKQAQPTEPQDTEIRPLFGKTNASQTPARKASAWYEFLERRNDGSEVYLYHVEAPDGRRKMWTLTWDPNWSQVVISFQAYPWTEPEVTYSEVWPEGDTSRCVARWQAVDSQRASANLQPVGDWHELEYRPTYVKPTVWDRLGSLVSGFRPTVSLSNQVRDVALWVLGGSAVLILVGNFIASLVR